MCDENLFSLEFLSSQVKNVVEKDMDREDEIEEEVEEDEDLEADAMAMDDSSVAEVEIAECSEVYQDDERDGDESEDEIETPVVQIKKKKTKKNAEENLLLLDQSSVVTPIAPDKKKKRKQEKVPPSVLYVLRYLPRKPIIIT